MHKFVKNKLFIPTVLSLIVFSCTNNSSEGVQLSNDEDIIKYGKSVYAGQCVNCHGVEGNSNLFGAKDLTVTALSETEIGDIIYRGKNTMPAFKNQLGEPEITAVAKYVKTMQKANEK